MTTAATGGGSYPLDHTHYEAMNSVLEIAAKTIPVMQKCLDCGLPVQDDIDTLKSRADFATKVKRNFFPDMP